MEPTTPCHLICEDFAVLCDEYMCSPEHTYFLSLVGSREAIRAIRALLLKGAKAELREGRRVTRVEMNDATKLLTQKLVPGRHLGFILSKRLLEGRALVVENESALPGAFRAAFDKSSEVPTHPTWAEWLWERAKELESCTPLKTRARQAYLMGDLAALEEALRRAVAARALCA